MQLLESDYWLRPPQQAAAHPSGILATVPLASQYLNRAAAHVQPSKRPAGVYYTSPASFLIEPMTSKTSYRVLLGLTGGIAAYKAAELCRLLVQDGADVRVVMTDAACRFVTRATMQALSGKSGVYRPLG